MTILSDVIGSYYTAQSRLHIIYWLEVAKRKTKSLIPLNIRAGNVQLALMHKKEVALKLVCLYIYMQTCL